MINLNYHSLDTWHMVWRRINKCFAVSVQERENEWKQISTSACSFKRLFICHSSTGMMCCPPEYHQETKKNSINHFVFQLTWISIDIYSSLQENPADRWMDKSIQQKNGPKDLQVHSSKTDKWETMGRWTSRKQLASSEGQEWSQVS